jgi:hypothetical protein
LFKRTRHSTRKNPEKVDLSISSGASVIAGTITKYFWRVGHNCY